MLMPISSKTLVLIFCLCNHYRVNRFEKMHGRSYFTQRRQNIVTFRQTSIASYTWIIISIISSFLQQNINLFESQETYRRVNQVYIQVVTSVLSTVLPLTWISSVWNSFPEFWSTSNKYNVKISISPQTYLMTESYKKELVPRGPYAFQHDNNQIMEDFLTKKIINGSKNKFGAIPKAKQIKVSEKTKTGNSTVRPQVMSKCVRTQVSHHGQKVLHVGSLYSA